jgi:selenoprotein W-related protein
LADKAKKAYGDQIEIEVTPSGGGAFEVSVDGEKIYSKLETGRFPSESAVLSDMEDKL